MITVNVLKTPIPFYYQYHVSQINLQITEVKFNNWDMGCTDLQFMAPYFRAILYRRSQYEGRGRKVLIDVGANAGDDTISITKFFQPILQMCSGYSVPIQLISIEPSPKVFCEMTDTVSTKLIEEDRRNLSCLTWLFLIRQGT